ncbi:hypothetical protein GQ42DRAFT_168684 [Ramicandelaber brevisporus]|nr:hypothetical protein GQ42DRAFT_168684 [Ramicandelaber brevisporus]
MRFSILTTAIAASLLLATSALADDSGFNLDKKLDCFVGKWPAVRVMLDPMVAQLSEDQKKSISGIIDSTGHLAEKVTADQLKPIVSKFPQSQIEAFFKSFGC